MVRTKVRNKINLGGIRMGPWVRRKGYAIVEAIAHRADVMSEAIRKGMNDARSFVAVTLVIIGATVVVIIILAFICCGGLGLVTQRPKTMKS